MTMREAANFVRDRGLGPCLATTTALGGAFAALVAVVLAAPTERVNYGAAWAALGTVAGGAVGFALWCLAGLLGRRNGHLGRNARVFENFREESRGRLNAVWRDLLAGGGRLPNPFRGYQRIAVPHRFGGSLQHRSDLIGALESSRVPGAGHGCWLLARPVSARRSR